MAEPTPVYGARQDLYLEASTGNVGAVTKNPQEYRNDTGNYSGFYSRQLRVADQVVPECRQGSVLGISTGCIIDSSD